MDENNNTADITAGKKEEKKKRKFRVSKTAQKRILVIFVVLLLCADAAFIYLVRVDRRFLRDLRRGLDASWDLKSGEMELQNRSENNSTKFLDVEYDAVYQYKDAKFGDEDLGKLAREYIEALEDCRKVAKEYDPDADFESFWSNFSEPYGKRLVSLYLIYKNDFGLNLDNTNRMKKDNLLAQGWILSKTETLEFSRVTAEDGSTYYETDVLNDSGFDLEFIDLEIELYDKKGNVAEKAVAHASDIQNGSRFDLRFYQIGNVEVEGYMIVSEVCKVKEKGNGKSTETDNKESSSSNQEQKTEQENGTEKID